MMSAQVSIGLVSSLIKNKIFSLLKKSTYKMQHWYNNILGLGDTNYMWNLDLADRLNIETKEQQITLLNIIMNITVLLFTSFSAPKNSFLMENTKLYGRKNKLIHATVCLKIYVKW